MTPELWQRIKAVVEEVDAAPSVDRASVLDRCCDGDPELRHGVERVLSEDGGGTFVQDLIGEHAANIAQTILGEQRFGHYQLVRRIGQGGMGTVYEAIRKDDFHKKVAIKVIQQELDSEFARARFLQERQLLANLEHPYIARLLDGGESGDGSPYLVMEFVDGRPITQVCAPLDSTARLRLFLKVCQAVEHAHRNLVIHRDLKPANILVTAEGEPKLLDFGIAKLIEPGGSATKTVFSALTPDYASPEQIRGVPITTASDVYSLGVILYQLLTGRKPYALDTATPAELDRIVCQEPPTSPGLGDELDHILLMALRKEPERRYAGVSQFADDIEQYLHNRPVGARPDTVRYRVKKFARRNRFGLAAASIALAGVCSGAVVALYQARIAQQRFNDVRQLANSFLFDLDKEIANVPGDLKARQMLVGTALKYLNNLARDAGGDLKLQREIAQAYRKVGDIQGLPGRASLGKLNEALVSYGRSEEIYGRIARKDPRYLPEMVETKINSAFVYESEGDLEKSIAEFRSAIAIVESLRLKKPRDPELASLLCQAWGNLGTAYSLNLNDRAALDAQRKSFALFANGTPANRSTQLMDVYLSMGDFDRALHAAKEALGQIGTPDKRAEIEDRLSQLYDSDDTPSLGDTGQALLHLQQADAQNYPNDSDARETRAIHLRRFSYLHGKASPGAGIPEGREAIALLKDLELKGKGNRTTEMLAGSQLLLAEQLSTLPGHAAEVHELTDSGLAAYRRFMDRSKGSLIAQRGWLRNLTTAARIYRNLGDLPASLAANRQSTDLASRLAPMRPEEVGLQYVVGNAYVEHGNYLIRTKQAARSREWFEKDARIWRTIPQTNRYVELRKGQADANLAKL